MIHFINVSSIGVSREAQLRAASLLEVISKSCLGNEAPMFDNFFDCSRLLMAERWNKLRNAIAKNEELLRFPDLPLQYCIFAKKFVETYPGKYISEKLISHHIHYLLEFLFFFLNLIFDGGNEMHFVK